MLKIKVWYKDENGESDCKTLGGLKPRRYMCGWDFERVMKYAKEELYWNDIEHDSVSAFEIVNEREQWCQGIPRPI